MTKSDILDILGQGANFGIGKLNLYKIDKNKLLIITNDDFNSKMTGSELFNAAVSVQPDDNKDIQKIIDQEDWYYAVAVDEGTIYI